MKRFSFILTLIVLFLAGCDRPDPADMLMLGAMVYTGSEDGTIAEAIAVRDGKIIAVGNQRDIKRFKGPSTKVVELYGSYVYPGFIEGHAHIMGIGENRLNVDLLNTRSYEEVINMVAERAANTPKGDWIVGRGWHQDKWEETPETMFRGFPTHDELSEAVPDHPVYLKHASGHAALVNRKAMELANLDQSTPDPVGGEIFKSLGNQPTGLLNETAQSIVRSVIPSNDRETKGKILDLAMKECLENGVTGFHQAGSPAADVSLFQEYAQERKLKTRLYVMLSGSDPDVLKTFFDEGPYFDTLDHMLTIRSVKLYADGALGSRGAWLLDPYADALDKVGHNVTPVDQLVSLTNRAAEAGFQVCTHAIGDRANREVLDMYEEAIEKYGLEDHRFRIEHAQHIDGDDIPRFAVLGVIPAMQAIHMSSDRPWAIDRLGKNRIVEGAYVWQSLLKSGAKIVNGSDAPVEPISPLASFYASVTRKTLKGTPDNGYEPDQCMTRQQALRSYTLDAAYGAFQEDLVGSIEVGKLADFTILDRDIMTIDASDILNTKVVMTIVGGDVLFQGD